MKVGLNNYSYCYNHDAAYRASMIYSFIATCNKVDIYPSEWMVDVMPLLLGEWKKSHPESHSMVYHTTEAEHVATILKSRAKRKEFEEEASNE